MKISDFDYELPENNIAIYPPEIRGNSRLLVLDRRTGEIAHKKYKDLSEYFHEGDVLVLNNTKVVKARLHGIKSTGGKVEFIVLEKHNTRDDGYTVMYRGHFKVGDQINIHNHTVRVEELLSYGIARLSSTRDLYTLADEYGEVPIPPYLHRNSTDTDEERYQTVFAKQEGSIAAPTASLNFTEEIKQTLIQQGVIIVYVTLHVGLGTFLPIRSDEVENHTMHSEYYNIPRETITAIQKAKREGRKITALGTTVTRTLEYAADFIVSETTKKDISGEANIFIYPGYTFKIIDRLITNFHTPRSTVLMLAAACAGWDNLQRAYIEAIKEGYQFLSYGDTMFIQ